MADSEKTWVFPVVISPPAAKTNSKTCQGGGPGCSHPGDGSGNSTSGSSLCSQTQPCYGYFSPHLKKLAVHVCRDPGGGLCKLLEWRGSTLPGSTGVKYPSWSSARAQAGAGEGVSRITGGGRWRARPGPWLPTQWAPSRRGQSQDLGNPAQKGRWCFPVSPVLLHGGAGGQHCATDRRLGQHPSAVTLHLTALLSPVPSPGRFGCPPKTPVGFPAPCSLERSGELEAHGTLPAREPWVHHACLKAAPV